MAMTAQDYKLYKSLDPSELTDEERKELIDFERAEVAHYFPEIFKISDNCRFNNCTHTHEPGCAVLDAVERGDIAMSRFTSYLSILDEDPNNKYRKPF